MTMRAPGEPADAGRPVEMHRGPRLLPPLPERTSFELPAPPLREAPQSLSPASLLIPALTSVSFLVYGAMSHQSALLILGLVITGGSLAAPFLMREAARRQARNRGNARARRYLRLLDQVATEMETARKTLGKSLSGAHPPLDDLPRAMDDLRRQWFDRGRLWERRHGDPDFLSVRLGTAQDVPSGLTVTVGANSSLDTEEDPGLRNVADRRAAAARVFASGPLSVSLAEHPVLAIAGRADAGGGDVGTRQQALALARALALELALACHPDDLQLLVVAAEEAAPLARDAWAWTSLIPHALPAAGRAGDGRGGRARAGVVTNGKDLAAVLTRTVGARVQLAADTDQAGREALPHLVIVLDGYHPVLASDPASPWHGPGMPPLLQEALGRAAALSVSVIAICRDLTQAPPESSAVVTLGTFPRDEPGQSSGRGKPARPPWTARLRLVARASEDKQFTALAVPPRADLDIATTIARVPLVTGRPVGGPGVVPLLGLRGRGPLAGPLSWPDRRPRDPVTLRPDAEFLNPLVGMAADGQPFTLDLKEGALDGSGPHGLLIGATGSGKSELLRTLVASLALDHGPQALQIALIDFKGGAAFDELRKLPHCAGLITNIMDDPSLIARMRAALGGELTDRQHKLNEASRRTNSTVRDIVEYWSARDAHPELALAAMPYLVTVIDEFAEFIDADPDFIDQLVTVARLGRSLGVHLVLSSQGVDSGHLHRLEQHLGYRIALRTFTAEQSFAALGSRVAARLPHQAGHGYFKSARTAGALVRFQAALVSPDLEGITAWMSACPAQDRAARLWLPPLPNTALGEHLALDDPELTPARNGDGLPVAVGLADIPETRKKVPAVFDTGVNGGHVIVVGAPRTGKSTALLTAVLQAARTYPAGRLRFLILDFGGGLLEAASGLPNVAAYAGPGEPERVDRVLTEARTLLERHPAAPGRPPAGPAAGQVTVLVIDNYETFARRYPEHTDVVASVLAEGAARGVHAHLSSPMLASLTPRMQDNIATRFELRLNEPAQSQHGSRRAAALGAAGPGRALDGVGRQVQFAAAALHGKSLGPDQLAEVVAEAGTEALLRGPRTPELPLLERVTAAGFAAAGAGLRAGTVLLGVGQSDLGPVEFEPGSGNLLLFGDPGTGRTATLARLLAGNGPGSVASLGGGADVFVVDIEGKLLDAVGAALRPAATATFPEDIEKLGLQLRDLLDDRRKARQAAARDAAPPARERPVVLVVDDFDLVCAMGMMSQRLAQVSPYLPFARRLGFSAVVGQLADGARNLVLPNPFIERALQSAPWRLHFSVGSQATRLPGDFPGRAQPPGVADLIRPGLPAERVRTLPPR